MLSRLYKPLTSTMRQAARSSMEGSNKIPGYPSSSSLPPNNSIAPKLFSTAPPPPPPRSISTTGEPLGQYNIKGIVYLQGEYYKELLTSGRKCQAMS